MSETNYMNMSLDEVIRDMKEKNIAGFGDKQIDNSPFLRKCRFPVSQTRFPCNKINGYKSTYFNERTNFLNNMAKKRVHNALKTLDLRHKLNRLRATTEGLDLRWKIVANEIARLRKAQNGSLGHAFKHYHPYGNHFLTRGFGADTNISGGEMIPRRSRVSLSHLERRVGMKLPRWIYGPADFTSPPLIVHQPHHHYHHHHNKSPIMYGSSVSVCCQRGSNAFISDPISAASEKMPRLIHEAPLPAYHSGIRNVSPLSKQHLTNDMPPPLAYQPPPPGRLTVPSTNQLDDQLNRHGTVEEIEYLVVEDGIESQQPVQHHMRQTLHQRFSVQY